MRRSDRPAVSTDAPAVRNRRTPRLFAAPLPRKCLRVPGARDSHSRENPPMPAVGHPSVSDEHVVQKQDIALLPGKTDGLRQVCLSNSVKHFLLYLFSV